MIFSVFLTYFVFTIFPSSVFTQALSLISRQLYISYEVKKTFHIRLLLGILNKGLNQMDCQLEDLDLWLESQIHFTKVYAVAKTLKLKTKTEEAVISY